MDFGSDLEMKQILNLSKDFFEHVLHDEHPLFVSDEATILDVSTSAPADLLERLSQHYKRPVSMDDLNRPLWNLLRRMNGL